MSFGWSAGDIVSALKLLQKITWALKDSGGASSEFQDTTAFLQTLSQTLQHLKTIQYNSLDTEAAENLRQQCSHIRDPVIEFLDDAGRRFGPALGANCTRNKVFTAPRKIQWALSASKRAKRLQDRITVPMAAVGIIFSQQVIQGTLRMPEDIQRRISHLIDAAIDDKITPAIMLIDNKFAALSVGQENYTQMMKTSLEGGEKSTAEKTVSKSSEDRETRKSLDDKLRRVLETQETSVGQTKDLHSKLAQLAIAHSLSNSLMVRNSSQLKQHFAQEIQKQSFENHAQSSSLHKKLEQVDASINVLQVLLQGLSTAPSNMSSGVPKAEVQQILQKISSGIWILLSSLQLLLRQLILLVAPYMVAIYRGHIQGLLLCGDRFLFEDALGRIQRLPCAQFQHWSTFYRFLVDSFQDNPGLSMVLTERFMLMNGYNNYPITREAWQAVIQPKSKVTMSIILDGRSILQGRCPDVWCLGTISTKTERLPSTSVCTICGKHVILLQTSRRMNEDNDAVIDHLATGSVRGAQVRDFMSEADERDHGTLPTNHTATTNYQFNQGAAFKRVVWEEIKHSNQTPDHQRQHYDPVPKPVESKEHVYEDTTNLKNTKDSKSNMNKYWLPNFDINKKVITEELQYYLGPDSTIRPYVFEGEDGFLITTPGECLTDEQIDDICMKSTDGCMGEGSCNSLQNELGQAS